MRTSTLLAQLRDRDIRLWLDGDKLCCNGPVGALTPELRRVLAEHKPEITTFLRTESRRSSLVSIQAEGRGRPFFGVPGHNGDVFCFVRLARHLGRDRPFLALEPPGVDGHGEPSTSIDDLARQHVQAVITAQPDGPYFLGGYCVGGLVAFEMARLLHAQRRDVAELVLFETTCPTAYRGFHARQIWARTLLDRVGRRLAARRWPRPSGHRRAHGDPVARGNDRVGHVTAEAARRYAPSVYPGRITFFGASRESLRRGLRRQRDWATLAGCGLALVMGPDDCDPDTMLVDPHASFFAERLRERLAAADARLGAEGAHR